MKKIIAVTNHDYKFSFPLNGSFWQTFTNGFGFCRVFFVTVPLLTFQLGTIYSKTGKKTLCCDGGLWLVHSRGQCVSKLWLIFPAYLNEQAFIFISVLVILLSNVRWFSLKVFQVAHPGSFPWFTVDLSESFSKYKCLSLPKATFVSTVFNHLLDGWVEINQTILISTSFIYKNQFHFTSAWVSLGFGLRYF